MRSSFALVEPASPHPLPLARTHNLREPPRAGGPQTNPGGCGGGGRQFFPHGISPNDDTEYARDPVAQATVEGGTRFTIDSLVAQYPGPIRQSERNPRLSQ